LHPGLPAPYFGHTRHWRGQTGDSQGVTRRHYRPGDDPNSRVTARKKAGEHPPFFDADNCQMANFESRNIGVFIHINAGGENWGYLCCENCSKLLKLCGKHQDNLVLTTSVKDRKSTRLNSSHVKISYAVFC